MRIILLSVTFLSFALVCCAADYHNLTIPVVELLPSDDHTLTIPVAELLPADGYTNETFIFDQPVVRVETKTHKRVVCPECQKTGKKSTAQITSMVTTTMFCGFGGYDENGNFSPPKDDCNTTTTYLECSRGHIFSQQY